jgi:hypothetical protein
MEHYFSYPRVAEYVPAASSQAPATWHAPEHEMGCQVCSVRMVASRAAELVEAGFMCPRCQTALILVST